MKGWFGSLSAILIGTVIGIVLVCLLLSYGGPIFAPSDKEECLKLGRMYVEQGRFAGSCVEDEKELLEMYEREGGI